MFQSSEREVSALFAVKVGLRQGALSSWLLNLSQHGWSGGKWYKKTIVYQPLFWNCLQWVRNIFNGILCSDGNWLLATREEREVINIIRLKVYTQVSTWIFEIIAQLYSLLGNYHEDAKYFLKNMKNWRNAVLEKERCRLANWSNQIWVYEEKITNS